MNVQVETPQMTIVAYAFASETLHCLIKYVTRYKSFLSIPTLDQHCIIIQTFMDQHEFLMNFSNFQMLQYSRIRVGLSCERVSFIIQNNDQTLYEALSMVFSVYIIYMLKHLAFPSRHSNEKSSFPASHWLESICARNSTIWLFRMSEYVYNKVMYLPFDSSFFQLFASWAVRTRGKGEWNCYTKENGGQSVTTGGTSTAPRSPAECSGSQEPSRPSLKRSLVADPGKYGSMTLNAKETKRLCSTANTEISAPIIVTTAKMLGWCVKLRFGQFSQWRFWLVIPLTRWKTLLILEHQPISQGYILTYLQNTFIGDSLLH